MSELTDLYLKNIERAAKGEEAHFGNMPFAHPNDLLKLIAEVRRLRAAPLVDIPQAELYAELERREAADPHALSCVCGAAISRKEDYFGGFCHRCDSKYDEIAKEALAGILSNPTWNNTALVLHGIPEERTADVAAYLAYAYAGAMLRRRRALMEERRQK